MKGKTPLFSCRAMFMAATSPSVLLVISLGIARAEDKEPAAVIGSPKVLQAMRMMFLPLDLPPLGFVFAAAIQESSGQPEPLAYPRSITFGGQTWEVKCGDGQKLGPGPNYFSDAPEHVWLDEKGYLHITIAKTHEGWQCTEVVAKQSLGYGEYRWVVSGDLATLDPRVVLGLFLYENDRQEIDFELSRWGSRTNKNAQFVVQPPSENSSHRFDTEQATTLTCSLVWKEKEVCGRCWVGEDTTREPLADWRYVGRRVPRPGRERARANLWLFQGREPTASTKQEVVIRSFVFKPGEHVDKRVK
jgi:hypothetical protein